MQKTVSPYNDLDLSSTSCIDEADLRVQDGSYNVSIVLKQALKNESIVGSVSVIVSA